MEVTLGISLGTRSIGVAILFGKELIKWNIHSYPGKWSSQKSKLIIKSISKILHTYEVNAIAVKVPKDLNGNDNTNHLIGAINVLAENFRIVPKYYTLKDIKSHYCSNEIINKSSLLDCIIARHTELGNVYTKSHSADKSYYAKLIEAVGVAHLGRQSPKVA